MDFEKAYKALVAKLKNAYLYAQTDSTKAVLEDCIPELAESEDERIRGYVTLVVKDWWRKIAAVTDDGKWPTEEEMLTYLEKQKENIEKEYVFRPLAGTDINDAALQATIRAYEGDHLVLAFNGAYIPVWRHSSAKDIVDEYNSYLEKQKEQKSELPLMNGDADLYFDEWRQQYQGSPTKRECFEEGIEYAQRVQKEQKSAEWKPLEESMEALLLAIEGKWDAIKPTGYMSRRLEDLYDGLVNTFDVDEKYLGNLPKTEYTEKDIEEIKALKEKIDSSMEQKPAEKQDYSGLSVLERAIHRGFLAAGVENVPVSIIKETAQECLAQMKPAEWSEEDRDMLNSTLLHFNAPFHDMNEKEKLCFNWLQSLPERFNLQPQQEWSEEEKKMLSVISYKISQHQGNDERSLFTPDEAEFISGMEDKFKSLRPQSKAELAKMLQDEYNKGKEAGEKEGYTKGYDKGYKDANGSVSYHLPVMPTTPSGFGCDGTHCTNPQMDCINCPIRFTSGMFTTASSSGDLTLKADWKPSKEQMGALSNIVEQFKPDKELESLYNDLKKLF